MASHNQKIKTCAKKKRILFVEHSYYVRSLHILDLHESSLEIEINPNKERQEQK